MTPRQIFPILYGVQPTANPAKTRPPRFAELETVQAFLAQGSSLSHCVLQGLDLRGLDIDWAGLDVEHTIFLGCRFDREETPAELTARGAFVCPAFPGQPYRPFRSTLYTWRELMAPPGGVEGSGSLDEVIYHHFRTHQDAGPSIVEALAQRIHDHAIDDALQDLLDREPRPRVVGLMGGHGVKRVEPGYRAAAVTARLLTRRGYRIATGGGPGIMEAGNLGAYLAPAPDQALDHALELLAPSPGYADPGFTDRAHDVLAAYPNGAESLAVPTWFYGHEPSNLFAAHVAKYFSNSIREDRLLSMALHGVVFTPGGAGTVQEIFQDACQNHYATFGWISPMVFLGAAYFGDRSGLFRALQTLAGDRPYARYLCLTDNPAEAADFIESHPPDRA